MKRIRNIKYENRKTAKKKHYEKEFERLKFVTNRVLN